MKKNNSSMQKIYIYILAFMVGITVILTAHFLCGASGDQNGEGADYNSGWIYFDGVKYKEIESVPVNIPWEKDTVLILRNVIPELDEYHNTLVFRSSNQKVKVYIDNKLIYTFGTEDNRIFGKTPGSIWNYVVIPEGSSGKQIEIKLESAYNDCAGFISSFQFGKYDVMQEKFLAQSLPAAIISIAILIYGIMLILIQGVLIKHADRMYGYIYIGVFSICVSVWSLLETQSAQFFYRKPEVLTLVTFYALMMIPISFNSFIREMYFENSSKMFTILNIAGYINIMVQTVLQVLNIVDVYEMVFVTHILIGITGIYNVAKVVTKYLKTKEDIYKRLALAFSILIGFGAIDVLRYYFGSFGDYARFFRIGILIFIAFISISYTKGAINLLKRGVQSETYEKMAYEDVLTKAGNRAYFEKELNEINESYEKYKSIAVAVFDINNLKSINDTYGHRAGDKIICKCAYCISSSFRDLGSVSRIGGDEFAVILKDVSEEIICSAIRIMNEKVAFYNKDNEQRLEIAYGYAMFSEEEDKDMEALFSRADSLMYAKKKQMKGTY